MDSEKTISVKKIVTNPPGSHIAREERACGARAQTLPAKIPPAGSGGPRKRARRAEIAPAVGRGRSGGDQA